MVMKRYIGSLSISLVIIVLFVTCLSLIKPEVKTEDLLAYEQVNETTTSSEETTTTTTSTTTERITTQVVRTTKREVVQGIGEIKGNVDITYLNMLNNELNKLPKYLLDSFVRLGWHIYVTDENIAKTYFGSKYSSVQGVTIYNDKVILIEKRNVAIKESTIHEFGHFVDYVTGFDSDTKYFKNIYEEEAQLFKSKISNSSCVRDEQELFAEGFFYLFKNPDVVPTRTKTFIESKMRELNK